jgi:hypothetical protein
LPGVDLLPFFTGIYGEPVGEDERYLCLGFLQPGGKMIERFFTWPREAERAIATISRIAVSHAEHGNGADTYFSVSLLTAHKRTKDFLDTTHCIWADLDDTPPNKLELEPTFLLQTSPGHYQAIWTLLDPIPYQDAEEFAKRIYHAHRKDGADACWDATRLLRVPGTPNLKYQVLGEGNPLVEIVSMGGAVYTPDDIDQAYPVSVSTGPGASQSAVLDYSQVELVGTPNEIMTRHGREIDQNLFDLYYDIPDPGTDWSSRLWALEMGLLECGLDVYEVFVLAQTSACNKYARDGRPDADLWKEVVRARDSMEQKSGMVLTTTEVEEIDILTPEEIAGVTEQPPGFIERYREWAGSRTDAPREFHVGGALMALSTALSDKVVVGTTFGEVRPNIWVMLLADSTISRKTTSMRLSQEISEGAGIDSLLATDGSMEGLLTELDARKGQTSVFVRDEFTSFVAGTKKKDYMSGMLSDLCGLYDGTTVKRRLRKEVIKVKDPIFLLFAGGVETKMLELLSHEDITSGFIPRFLPIFGHTTVAELTLIGPRRERSHEAKDALISELRTILELYTPPRTIIKVPSGDGKITQVQPLDARLSDAAWNRLRDAQRYLLEVAENHDSRDLLLPCTERLITNVLKVACLIAASRQRPLNDHSQLIIELEDMLMSLYYARGWLDHLLRIVTKIGRDPFDGKTHQVLEYITYGGGAGMSRSSVMRHFRANSRDLDEILNTLLDREEIVSEGGAGPTARGAIYRATQYARTARQIRVTAPLKIRRTDYVTRR